MVESKKIKNLPRIISALFVIFFVIYGAWFNIGRHAKTNSGRFDLGNMEQTVWNFVHGHGFVLTDPYGTATVSRFAFHADPFLYILTPIYAILPFTETLLLLQVFAVASGAIAVWLISRKLLKSQWWAALSVGLYVVNPAVHWSMSFDIHAVTFAIPLILWAIWAMLKKRWWWLLIFVVLAMTTKEQVGLGLTVFGLYTFFVYKKRKWGTILTAVPLIWSLVMLFIVLPHFRTQTLGDSEVYRTVFGTGAWPIVKAFFVKPLDVLSVLLTKQNILYWWQLFLGSGLIGIASPVWLASTPDLVINGLSLKPAQHQLVAHYASTIVPWIIFATIQTTAWIIKRTSQLRWRNVYVAILAIWLIIVSLYGVWSTGSLMFAKKDQTKFVTWRNPYATLIADWSKHIPTSAAVSVTNDVGAHFARREHLYSFPLGIDQADYIVVLENHSTPVVATDAEVSTRIAELRVDAGWSILEQNKDLTILRRK